MDFSQTEERRMLVDSISRFLEKEYPLSARTLAAESQLGFDTEKWTQFADLGVIGALFSENHGGFGGSGFDLAAVFEALGHELVVEPLLDCALLPGAVFALANKIDYVDSIVSGQKRYALAAEEDDSHFDLAWVSTTAQRDCDEYVISGKKVVVKFAEGSDGIIVSARTSGEMSEHDGISLFLVPFNASGLSLRGFNTIDGGRAATVSMDTVRVPAAELIGDEGNGHALLTAACNRGQLALVAEALGIMERIKRMTTEYLHDRKQFGMPIGNFQALQHRMVQLLIEIEQARSSVINAAAAIDTGDVDTDKTISAAKYTIGHVGAKIAEESIQMHGGIGMTWEFDLAHYAKRLIMIDHELGDEDYHLSRYVSLSQCGEKIYSAAPNQAITPA